MYIELRKTTNHDDDNHCNKCQHHCRHRHHHHHRLGTTTHMVLIVHNKTDEHNFKISTLPTHVITHTGPTSALNDSSISQNPNFP